MSNLTKGKIKQSWIPVHAADLEVDMRNAPGASKPPPRRKPRRNMKLELADAEISACKWCGIWTVNVHCSHCEEHGYPTIDDIKETA